MRMNGEGFTPVLERGKGKESARGVKTLCTGKGGG